MKSACRLVPALLLVLSSLCTATALAQDFSGNWKGTLEIEIPKATYIYRLELQQQGHHITGTSYMRLEGTDKEQAWKLNGIYDGHRVLFSETEKVGEHKGCWKGMRLAWFEKANTWELSGVFNAPNCTIGGNVLLRRAAKPTAEPIAEPENPLLGRWQGVLTQDDKDFDFSYELNLLDQGEGNSSIAIEYGGGVGDHLLGWKWNEAAQTVSIDETQLLYDGSIKGWYWCFKEATLTLREEADHYVLEGPWEGTVFDGNACSPGMITLRKRKAVPEAPPTETAAYSDDNTRHVQVAEQWKTPGNTLQLTIWDNAQEDGDRITIFVNDEPVLSNLRTTKKPSHYEVPLQPGDNYLIFHAENLGDSPPNTAAVIFQAPGLKRRIILRSDLQTSSAVLIQVEE